MSYAWVNNRFTHFSFTAELGSRFRMNVPQVQLDLELGLLDSSLQYGVICKLSAIMSNSIWNSQGHPLRTSILFRTIISGNSSRIFSWPGSFLFKINLSFSVTFQMDMNFPPLICIWIGTIIGRVVNPFLLHHSPISQLIFALQKKSYTHHMVTFMSSSPPPRAIGALEKVWSLDKVNDKERGELIMLHKYFCPV